MDKKNEDVIKAAANRMCEQLAGKKIKVSHTAMLEALATGFGLDSWRELKAVIDAPRGAKPTEKEEVPPLGEWQKWDVDAVYLENSQPYGQDFSGRTPLEAAINCLVERLTDFGNEMGIFSVTREGDGEALLPSSLNEIELHGNGVALRTLMEKAKDLEYETLSEAAKLAFDMLKLNFESGDFDESMSDLTDWHPLEKLPHDHAEPVTEGESITPTQALVELLDAVETHLGGVVKMEKDDTWESPLSIQIYQVRAMCAYFGPVIDSSHYGLAHSLVNA